MYSKEEQDAAIMAGTDAMTRFEGLYDLQGKRTLSRDEWNIAVSTFKDGGGLELLATLERYRRYSPTAGILVDELYLLVPEIQDEVAEYMAALQEPAA
tara:strand:+ start:526 stop:819 length:294 start_codon:yes stop_codon:yes gene_type:complete